MPENWNIILNRSGVFGGFTDNRPKNLKPAPDAKPVYMDLEAVFGGGELRCYE